MQPAAAAPRASEAGVLRRRAVIQPIRILACVPVPVARAGTQASSSALRLTCFRGIFTTTDAPARPRRKTSGKSVCQTGFRFESLPGEFSPPRSRPEPPREKPRVGFDEPAFVPEAHPADLRWSPV
ncbi:hypothetical protein Bbelb_141570 [Branchiostoma belcheri]|nr:hypothetical protein Bbelb_141570 [Branchiostoma belcheri]